MKLSRLAQNTELFRGLGQTEIESLLDRLNGVKKTYRRGETVVHAGFSADRLILVASGHLHVYEQMSDDRPVLVREIGQGEALGLWILHMPEIACWPGTIVAVENCTLISLDMARMRALLAEDEPQIVVPLTVNSSRMLSRELFTAWRKLTVMDAQTIEARIKIYLSELNNESGGTGDVTVPFNRERMAEYFGVARPSLSRTLCQMRDRGLLTWHKNIFKINF
ncbi:MAG: Crp/Fnr family transcriptional regulator [bacterium]|nr:Crp/Fnr family transcriptional regulator [bacterium]